jgi:uncharacterized protein (UPF0333 family)
MAKSKQAQSILEYALVLMIVIAALMIMSYYTRNSLAGKIRATGDIFGKGEVYDLNKTVVTYK